ncbi:MAG TPA: hypothetical protein PKA02_02290 [Candidatus Saccharibacteria bacterium]|nr:hypothetical protein [Candidatus Saccharibacteria bacterium]
MSEHEHAPKGPEHTPRVERHEQEHPVEAKRESLEKKESHQFTNKEVESIRSDVKQEAISGKDVAIDTAAKERVSTAQPLISRDLRATMLQRTLTSIRKKLPLPYRSLSKVVHNKPVEVISSASEKTIARPIGLLGGGMAALGGSIFSFYMASHYGYKYNFLLYILLFIAGYIVFTAGEFLFLLVHRQRHGR